MAKAKKQIKTFTSTSEGLYDRHRYKLILNNGKAVVLEDYEDVRQFWFQFRTQLNCVEVL